MLNHPRSSTITNTTVRKINMWHHLNNQEIYEYRPDCWPAQDSISLYADLKLNTPKQVGRLQLKVYAVVERLISKKHEH